MQWDSNRIGRNSRFGSEIVDKVKTPFIKGVAWCNLDKWSYFIFDIVAEQGGDHLLSAVSHQRQFS